MRQLNNRLIIEIADNGPGLEREDIFSFQSDGYGLANIQSRIKYSYGSDYGITAENIPEVGVVFRIEIPVLSRKS